MLRASEVRDLQWQQIELSEGRLHVHRVKNGIPSLHPIYRRWPPNWRLVAWTMGSPPEPVEPAYRTLRLPWKHRQVLGADLNCSESSRGSGLWA